ncbi:hypothetical protein jhhlp_000756 [Lomentospora prolificans]|uniref:F-box domain-containing protein n=1 Tax=Lomentospora prolificans TaxID=41688 RepID=A0A2N3NJG0_9PEZI|nr:hypothetical protein jhhlp_000756 [Lomentospora prolificans]
MTLSIESLPQDIVDDIVSYLLPDGFKPKEPCDKRTKPSPPLAPLATVSRRLQAAVERLTFKYIEIDSGVLEQFEEVFTVARRPLLTSLTFTAVLPAYDSADAVRAESPADRAANDERYSRSVQDLFRILLSWEVEDPRIIDSRLVLVISHPASPTDSPWPSSFAPWRVEDDSTRKASIHEGRYLHSYIELLHPDKLPVLRRIRELVMLEPRERWWYRNVCPNVPFVLASHMPNLEGIQFTVDDNEERFPDLRKHNRDEAARSIQALSLPNLKRLCLNFLHRRYRNEGASPPVLHEPGPDPLSLAICQLSLNLVDVDVSGVFDLSLLRPLQGLSETSWPNLKYLAIEIHAMTPSGGWYFTGRGPALSTSARSALATSQHTLSTLHEEEFRFLREAEYANLVPFDLFRMKVNEETLAPFIEAYADALSVMPKLKSAALNCQLSVVSPEDNEPCWFNLSFFAPCPNAKEYLPNRRCPKCGDTATRQLITSYLGWVPSEELTVKLRSIQDRFSKEPMVEKDVDTYLMERENYVDSD